MCRLQSSLTLTWCSRIPEWSLIWGRVLHYIFIWARNISPDILFHGKELILSQYNPVCLGAARTVRKVIFPHSHCPSCSCPHTASHSALCGRTKCPAETYSGIQRCSMNVPLWTIFKGQNPLLSPWNGITLFCLSVFSCHCTHLETVEPRSEERKSSPKVKWSPSAGRRRPEPAGACSVGAVAWLNVGRLLLRAASSSEEAGTFYA